MAVATSTVPRAIGPVIDKWVPGGFAPNEVTALAALSCLAGDDERFTAEGLAEVLKVLDVRLSPQMIGKFEQFRIFGVIHETPGGKIWARQHHWWHYVRWYFKTGASQEFKAVNRLLLDRVNAQARHDRNYGVMLRQALYTWRLGHTTTAAQIIDELVRTSDPQASQRFLTLILSDMPS